MNIKMAIIHFPCVNASDLDGLLAIKDTLDLTFVQSGGGFAGGHDLGLMLNSPLSTVT